jgi:xylulokinase
MRTVMGLDIGTSNCKAGIITEKGELLGFANREYQFTGNEPWTMEADANQVWILIAESIREAIDRSGIDAKNIAAIGLSVLGEACMPVDENGVALRPGIHALDTRANYYEEYVNWWRSRFTPDTLFEITSYPLSYLPSVMRFMWMRDHEPEIFKRTRRFCTFQDFAVWKLTGSPAIDFSMASRTFLLDVTKHTWSEELLKAANIPTNLLSPLHESTDIVGELTEKASEETGLAVGTKVVVGSSAQPAAALAVGAIRDGVVMNGAGSSEAIGVPTFSPLTGEQMLARGQGSQCHVQRDMWLALGFHLTAGHLVKWTRDQFAEMEVERESSGGENAYDQITARAAKSPPGANGVFVLPHWLGSGTGVVPCLEPTSRGAIFGLTISNSREDIYRAIFEAMNMEVRLILESFEEANIPTNELKVSGGGAKSAFWLQNKADVTGKQVAVPAVAEASLFGAAMLAATGIGVYSNLDDACTALCRDVAYYEPDGKTVRIYDRQYAIYKDIYTSLLPLNRRIAGLTSR